MRNNCEVTSHQQIQRRQYVVEVVVEDFVAVLGVLHREVVTRTHEEEVAHHVSDHLLVQVSVINMLPVCVLKSRFNVISRQYVDNDQWHNHNHADCIVSDLEYDGILLQLRHGPLGPEDGVDHVKES